MELLNNPGDDQMDKCKDTAIEAILEQLIETGPGDIAGVFARAFEMTMRLERERFLGARHYERTSERQGYANGYKPKRIDTPAGSVNMQVPKTAGHGDAPFYPQPGIARPASPSPTRSAPSALPSGSETFFNTRRQTENTKKSRPTASSACQTRYASPHSGQSRTKQRLDRSG